MDAVGKVAHLGLTQGHQVRTFAMLVDVPTVVVVDVHGAEMAQLLEPRSHGTSSSDRLNPPPGVRRPTRRRAAARGARLRAGKPPPWAAISEPRIRSRSSTGRGLPPGGESARPRAGAAGRRRPRPFRAQQSAGLPKPVRHRHAVLAHDNLLSSDGSSQPLWSRSGSQARGADQHGHRGARGRASQPARLASRGRLAARTLPSPHARGGAGRDAPG